ncbi:MAG: polysaccharide deacetylase family protein [Candidatus Nanopelagicales bacterium]
MVNSRLPVSVAVAATIAVTVGIVGSDAAHGLGHRSTPAPVAQAQTEVGLPSEQDLAGQGSERAMRRAPKWSLPRDFYVKTHKRIFFLTIDDGYGRTGGALRFVRQHKIPVTVFLTNAAIQGHASYYRKITRFGGSVQNHTMTHKSFTSPSVHLKREICRTQKTYRRVFGSAPTLLRPPYGNGGYLDTPMGTWKRISRTAAGCGVKHVVMWDAVVAHGQTQFARGTLRRGGIVLAHFGPGLENDLRAVMATARRKGLKPAILTDFLK